MIENIEEAKELLKKYRSITLEEINKVYDKKPEFEHGDDVLHEITGFGMIKTCILCKKLKSIGSPRCSACVWRSLSTDENDEFYCLGSYPSGVMEEDRVEQTYDGILNSEYPEELLDLVELRADLLEEAIKASELLNKKEENENRRE